MARGSVTQGTHKAVFLFLSSQAQPTTFSPSLDQTTLILTALTSGQRLNKVTPTWSQALSDGGTKGLLGQPELHSFPDTAAPGAASFWGYEGDQSGCPG